jgi:hypothetical protein
MSLSDCTGSYFDDPTQPQLQNANLKAAAAAEVHRDAWSTQGTRRCSGLIRAALLSEGPQSTASRLIVCADPFSPTL